jgi:hypothetical protein
LEAIRQEMIVIPAKAVFSHVGFCSFSMLRTIRWVYGWCLVRLVSFVRVNLLCIVSLSYQAPPVHYLVDCRSE